MLITGASGGMGKHMVEWFRNKGLKLVLHYHDHAPAEMNSDDICAIQADLRDPAQIDSMIANALERFGRVDLLVDGASIASAGLLLVWEGVDISVWRIELRDQAGRIVGGISDAVFRSRPICGFQAPSTRGPLGASKEQSFRYTDCSENSGASASTPGAVAPSARGSGSAMLSSLC